MSRAVIVVEGGLVQQVISEHPLEVLILDYDTEGANENELVTVFDEECVSVETEGSNQPEMVDIIFKNLTEKEGQNDAN